MIACTRTVAIVQRYQPDARGTSTIGRPQVIYVSVEDVVMVTVDELLRAGLPRMSWAPSARETLFALVSQLQARMVRGVPDSGP